MDKIESIIRAFKLEGEFVFHTQVTFGEYDFDEKAFPVHECRSNHDWKVARDPAWSFCSHPPVLRFENTDQLKWIRLPPDEAERFLESRMDDKGRPNRKLNADLIFQPRRRSAAWSNQRVISDLVAFKFYEDDERKEVVYEFPKRRLQDKPAITAEDVLREVEGESKPLNDAQNWWAP